MNLFTINYKKREKEERRWLSYAKHVFYDADSTKPPFKEFESKTSGFLIPIFEKESNDSSNAFEIVYGGVFYKKFREPFVLQRFLDNNKNSKYSFNIYSNLKHLETTNNKVKLYSMVNLNEYSQICSKSSAIIVIGNGEYLDVFPSKLIEAFSYKKPVIMINFKELPPYALTYPMIINGDSCLIDEEMSKIDKKQYSIDIFDLFPERNPKILIDCFVNAIFNKN